MITIMGATGQVGGKITSHLMESGQSVKALGRSEVKLAALQSAGATVAAGDAYDAAYLANAFQGSEAIFILLPSDPTLPDYLGEQEKFADAISSAAQESGVPYIVALSSMGADLPSGTGFIASLFGWEERLRGLTDTRTLILRPGYFYENFFGSLELIKKEGIIVDSVAPDVPIPMIATRDIAAIAAQKLIARDWKGSVVRELEGPRPLTMSEVARLIGTGIGNPDLRYLQMPDREMIAALTESGISDDFARLHVETNAAISNGTIRAIESRTERNTTPTKFEDFVGDLEAAYHSL